MHFMLKPLTAKLTFTVVLATLMLSTQSVATAKPNIIYILCDDHRFDAMSCMGHPFLETPHLDAMAKNGVQFTNAFVTNSLCSPSRASILTGLYPHNHGVGDNYNPVDPKLKFFPQYLQQAGYETAFIGKWHMGDIDEPQRGFDHWCAFRGQGTYYPDGHGTTRVVPQTRYDGFNINGKRVPQKGYITDELTDYAIAWMKERKAQEKPFFCYISHKAVHSDFVGRDGERGKYKDKPWKPPVTFANTPENRKGKPRWLIDQRNSRHGSDYGYNLKAFDVETYHKRYCEALSAVDDNVGRVMAYLKSSGDYDNTIVVYMGDNGFHFGEQGLIDKRVAYEPSIRVPLLVQYPAKLKAGMKVDKVVANIDIGPTMMEVAGQATPDEMDGASFWKLAMGQSIPWRDALLYEYYWEWNYPMTPTIFAVRGQRYKYIRAHGVWDTDELYDLQEDPDERFNLIRSEEHQEIVSQMNNKLFTLMRDSGGLNIPLKQDRGRQFYYRNPKRSAQGAFPEWFYEEPAPVTK